MKSLDVDCEKHWIGPKETEQTAKTPSYPYVVVKTEGIADKNVEFR